MHAISAFLLLVLAPDPVPAGVGVPDGAASGSSIWERLRFYANGRLRGESTVDQPNGEDRHRGRMRFRVGATYDLMDDVTAEARITTTSGDSNNPHWDFGSGADGFNGMDMAFDRFFLKWRACEDLSVQAGKFPHAFAGPPVYGEFLWDDDVHPSGAAATWGPGKGDGVGYDVRGAGYVAVENSGGTDPSMVGVQGNLYLDAGERADLQLSSSLMDWTGLSGGGGVPGNQGNTDVTGDFLIWESFAAATVTGGPMRQTTGFVQLMKNLDESGENGFAFGARFGTSGKKGDANLFATYYDIDADAIFSPPAQDDTPITGTGVGMGMEGAIAGGQFWITDNLAIKVWGLTSDADTADDPTRVRFDIDFTVR